LNSKINIGLHQEGRHNVLFSFYKELIRLRKEVPALSSLSKECMEVKGFEGNTPLTPLDRGESEQKVLFVRRWFERDETFCLYNFNKKDVEIRLPLPKGLWLRILASSSEEWGGDGSVSVREIEPNGPEISLHLENHSFVLYRRDISAV
jgi:maltooligosyltrehalose trehalohydrolase